MKSKYLFALGGLLLLIYSVFAKYFAFSNHILASLNNFTTLSRQLFLLAALLLLLWAVNGSATKSTQEETNSARSVRTWWIGFVPMLVIALALGFYVNPHARFFGDKYPPVNTGAREIKVNLFSKLDSAPKVVIMGSSRAFTLSPKYIQEKTGFSVFNMAVESGGAGDYFVQANYIVHSDLTPRVLLMEIHQNTFGDVAGTWEIQPLPLIAYLPLDGATAMAKASLEDAFSLQSVSDSLFAIFLSDAQRQTWTLNLDPQGLGIRTTPTHSEYEKLLSNTIKGPTKNNIYCKRLAVDGRRVFEDIMALAKENGIGVVLYESPMNYAFSSSTYKMNPEGFDSCRELLRTYLQSLTQKFPNVFFQDLSLYEPITKLEEEGFYDAIHLRPKAADMVIDKLLPELQSAMNWSLQTAGK
jgi:hypothetical protein